MKISSVRKFIDGGSAGISAHIEWEDNNRPSRDVYFAVPEEFCGDIFPNPHAFLVSAIVPAMYLQESRIAIEGEVSSVIADGLRINMAWLRKWYGDRYKSVRLDVNESKLEWNNESKRTAMFLSGGVDSLFSLKKNRRQYANSHEHYIQDGLLVHGFDIWHDETEAKRLDLFDKIVSSVRKVGEAENLQIIPVYTNIRHLCSETDFWMHWFHGAAMAGILHALSERIGRGFIATSDPVEQLGPWGTHPLLDQNFSGEIRVFHDGLAHARFDKIRTLSKNLNLINALRVCTSLTSSGQNCGSCEKCIRTMTALVALDLLDKTIAFPRKDITAADIRSVGILREDLVLEYLHMTKELDRVGRADLATAVRSQVEISHRSRTWHRESGFKGFLRKADRKFFNGAIRSGLNLITDAASRSFSDLRSN